MRPDDEDDDEPADDEAEPALWPDDDPDWRALLAEQDAAALDLDDDEAALAAWLLLDDLGPPQPRRVYPAAPTPAFADERAPRHAETVSPLARYL